jgi:hypothetical protein
MTKHAKRRIGSTEALWPWFSWLARISRIPLLALISLGHKQCPVRQIWCWWKTGTTNERIHNPRTAVELNCFANCVSFIVVIRAGKGERGFAGFSCRARRANQIGNRMPGADVKAYE